MISTKLGEKNAEKHAGHPQSHSALTTCKGWGLCDSLVFVNSLKCFDSGVEKVLLRKYPLSTDVSVGSLVTSPCRASQPSGARVQQGQKLSLHTGVRMVSQAPQDTCESRHLTPTKLQPQISASTSPVGITLFLGKYLLANSAHHQNPQKVDLHQGNMFPDGHVTRFGIFGESQPARLVWTVSGMPQRDDFAKHL